MHHLVNQTIHHYHILEKIGQGGMGIVYKAEDLKLHRIVALKILPGYIAEDPIKKTRFLREARMAAALDHPNIATVYEVVDDEDFCFLAMAYIDGETLDQRLQKGPLSIDEVLDYARQIAAGLQEAHRNDIIHRDIKASNIMINKRGEIKITDFGLAKLRGSSTITMPGAQLGTAAYMAPEVIQGEEADHRSDIFSFGVLLYKMLTRKSPFKGENDQAVMFSIVYEKPQPIIKLRQDVPQPLMDLVYRMLEKDPEDRVQDIQEVLTILNDIHSGKTTVTSKPFFSRITGRLPNTARPIFITSLVALLFIAIVVVRIILSPTHPAFKERDWILIANFDNQTNEEIFNRSLDKAFHISIEQSRYVNVFPPDRIRSVLQRMKRSDVQFIDKEIGCEIALREGITAVLVPTITRLENAYSLTAEIINPVNGKLLASEITYANSREEVLDALDELTRRIRKRLGEALAAISERSRPLRQVTTSSLEALKYYSVAYDHLRRAEYEEARQFLESALEKDSTFTVAKATLGRLHFDQSPYEEGFDREKGIQLLKEAVEEIEHLTEREKYPILAWYAQAVEKDLPKAIRYAKELVTLYPDLSTAHNTLGYLYSLTGRYQEAIKEYQQAIRLDPYLMIAYNNLSITYMFQLGSEIDSARVWCLKQIKHNPEHFWAYYHLGWAYLGMDSLQQARNALEKAYELHNRWKTLPHFTWHLERLGITHLLLKNYSRAIDVFKEINRVNPEAFIGFYYAGITAREAGNMNKAIHFFNQYQSLLRKQLSKDPQNKDLRLQLALVLLQKGEKEAGWKLGTSVCAEDSTLHFEHAELLALYGKPLEAIKELQAAVEHGYRNFVWMKINPNFLSLREIDEFKELTNKLLKQSHKSQT